MPAGDTSIQDGSQTSDSNASNGGFMESLSSAFSDTLKEMNTAVVQTALGGDSKLQFAQASRQLEDQGAIPQAQITKSDITFMGYKAGREALSA